MNVFIEGGGNQYISMFMFNGFTVVDNLIEADLVCFTGGADVDPKYYNEEPHKYTCSNPCRDEACFGIYNHCIEHSIPMVGICRGSQFLCVANGGELWQHVDNHAIGGSHKATDVVGGFTIDVTSTHHQMMRPKGIKDVDYEVILTAYESVNKDLVVGGETITVLSSKPDVEAVIWPHTKSFGFQPHPEFPTAPESCTKWFFEKLKLILE